MEIKKINDNTWELPKTGKMVVPGRIYASEKLLSKLREDGAIQQVANVASLKGIQKYSYAMADAHVGYGFPIGGVAAFDMKEGIISPGGVGYDINCSVRLLSTQLSVNQILSKRKEILDLFFKEVPAGVGKKSVTTLKQSQLQEVLANGVKWAVENGYGFKEDAEKTEDEGCLKPNDPHKISETAIKRGMPQLGTLGAGNHFLEIQKVDEIYEPEIARKMGITKKDQVTIMVHCGSRGLGHQVASDYIKLMEQKYGFENLPDRELVNAPINSDLGQDYFKAMNCAANFGFANKQLITHWIRESLTKIMGINEQDIQVVYDVCHNIAKMETHEVDGEKKKLCVHRKGATRSFGPGREELPDCYQSIGQPVIIPGSMGTASYLLVGTKEAEKLSFSSTAHGAGRVSSRSAALRDLKAEDIIKSLSKKDIILKGNSMKGIVEEAPEVYKDIDEVIRVSKEVGLARPIVRLVPLGVIKG
jgi:tRNA-splicing ligase RtcB